MKISKKWIVIGIVFVIAVTLTLFRVVTRNEVSIKYITAKVDRGDISSFIVATGTLNPVNTVEVGTLVSGVVKEIYVDFNSTVKKGDALIQIEPTPFKARLAQAQANLEKARADLNIAKTIMKANKELYTKRLISKQEYDDSKLRYSNALATFEQAKAELEIAKENLENTTIRSPIDGIVISRKVNVGQMVSPASNSYPLFVIAENLTKMRLDAHVNEADIGKIKEGNKAVFTVDAYPDQSFTGEVRQIKNEPIKVNNVVTYDVVILVDNRELKLKPGMTAEVKIFVAHRENVLRVPRAALRFIPPPSARISADSHPENPKNLSLIWIPLKDMEIKAIPVKTGISDENYTELLDSTLKEGDSVIVEALVEKNGTGNNPLGPLPQIKRF
ncbi:MAG: RND transporter [Deltaproteobacteria bacterium]|jgi:HlyD family secretion protein|nr:MAG: RND transporter [Deltaproteobacteria bacterium]